MYFASQSPRESLIAGLLPTLYTLYAQSAMAPQALLMTDLGLKITPRIVLP